MFRADVLEQLADGFEKGTKVHTVVTAFATTMLEPMIQRYSLYPAKGTTIAHYAHNSDQMMLTHIFNGLFPALNLIYHAQRLRLPRLSRLGEDEIKLYVLAYSMHDLDKILGDDERFQTLTARGVAEALTKMLAELEKINARAFLPTLDEWAGEILWLVVNTQRSRDINLSHNTFVAHDTGRIDAVLASIQPHARKFRSGIESTLRDLCTFSDLVAYFIKSPEDALLSSTATRRDDGILELMRQLTDNGTNQYFTLGYHKLTEVRGLLGNQINNGTMRYVKGFYSQDQEPLLPYLFFPNGVVYLDLLNRPAPLIHMEDLQQVIKDEIQQSCGDLVEEGEGFGFNHLGLLKYPRYLHDFLSVERFLQLFAQKTRRESRVNVAENTLQKMRGMQAEGVIPATIALDYTPTERIAMLGRFLINYIAIIDENLDKASHQLKVELEQRLITRIGEDLWHEAQLIPSSGGVNYRFYWLAARYLITHPLAKHESESPGESLEGLFNELISEILDVAGKELKNAPGFQGPYLQDLSDYLSRNLSFGFGKKAQSEALPDFAAELAGYVANKKPRSSRLPCTVCVSAYPTIQQEDASVLFQPWVYKNRLQLYKSENAGGICSICSLELMLRQLLLTDKPGEQGRIKVTGKGYEDMELKYFFLYPGFFFTHQTYRLTSFIIHKMQNLKLYELCEVIREKERISTADILSLSCFNLTPIDQKSLARLRKEEKEEEKEQQEEKGRMYLFDRYEEKQYPGFIFFAKKTFRKKKSGETTKVATASWVEAAWLGLALPLVTGARVVVTESYLPLYNSAADFLETVVLDAPHQSLRHLLLSSSARLRLDELYGRPRHGEGVIGGVMAACSRAIELHIDTERVGGDLKLERFTRIARDLETDQLFVFSFLKEQLRRDRLDTIPHRKAGHYNALYHQFVHYYQACKGDMMTKIATRHERVTDLYLQFYLPFNDQKKWPTSRAIVRPVDIAANVIIKDSLHLTEEELKLEMFQALKSWLDIVGRKEATGRVIAGGKTQDSLLWQFVETFYQEVFLSYAEGQRSLLHSRLNRFKGGCEAVFSLRMGARKDNPELPAEEEVPVEAATVSAINDSKDVQ